MKKIYFYIIVSLLIVSCLFAFGRAIENDFIKYDDDMLITESNNIQSGLNSKSIKWAATAVVVGNWHPLTLLSHMLDWRLFGAKPSGHHLVSLILHIGAVIFLFLFLNKTTNNLWSAAFAAALFALHPLTVAWAAERKDVLSMFFGMATLYAYALYVKRLQLSKYILCLILFILSLMSKPMMVTLPFAMMLLDYWPFRRWQKTIDDPHKRFNSIGRLVGEKIPFICLTVFVSIITLWAQNKAGATSFGAKLPFITRGANAIVSFITYLEKTFWPVNLAFFYTYNLSFPSWKILISAIILTAITLTVIYYIKKMPFLFTGWFWYLGTLVPVIGLVQSGTQAMADRYTYPPSLGIVIMLAWGIPSLVNSENLRKKVLFPAAILVLIIMAFLSWRQCGHWKNSITIWNHTLTATDNNYLAYSRLGNAYGRDQQYQKAIDNFNEVIRIRPDYAIAYNGKGFSYNAMGMYQNAIDELNKAINLNPEYAAAYNNRAYSYFMLGDSLSGCKDSRKACDLGICKALEAVAFKELCR